MSISIYSPAVRREAQLFGISELQAWRNLNAREMLRDREAARRWAAIMAR